MAELSAERRTFIRRGGLIRRAADFIRRGGVVRRVAELSAERRSCPPLGGVSAEWRSCPPSGGVVRRRKCPPADSFGGLAFFGGLFWRTSPRVRRGPRRVRSESNGVRDFSADSWRTLSGLGGVRSGGLEGGVRSESNGVQWSPMESARSPLGQRSATDIAKNHARSHKWQKCKNLQFFCQNYDFY
ncbi:MAG: hypothetical protein GY820_44425 [Gammaproteobacteria bacterium]|nr:hypothetical protein [Gammaproteobacteria bacterium]